MKLLLNRFCLSFFILFFSTFFNHSIASQQKPSITLTQAEKTFISTHPIIRFRVRKERPPFEFERDGNPVGLAIDYLKLITEKVGMEAEFVFFDAGVKQSLDIVEQGRTLFDSVAILPKTEDYAQRFVFGEAYLSYPMVIITNNQHPFISRLADLSGKTVAIESGFITNKWLQRDHPNIQIIPAKTTADALRMVNSDKADAYIGNLAIASYMLMNGGLSNLKIAAPSGYGNVDYHLMAPKEWPELASILSKGYNAISTLEHSALQQKWFTVQIVEKFNYRLLWQILSGVAIFVAGIIWWNYSLRIQKRKTEIILNELRQTRDDLEIMAITDQLTSVYNRAKLDHVLHQEFDKARRFNFKFAVVMLDIDHFKSINDTFGHIIGDKVLIKISELIVEHFDLNDVIGRWGGEEFLIVCPHTNSAHLEKLSDHLRKIIEETIFPSGSVTCSFGVAQFDKSDTKVETIVARADKALYSSKQHGRNRVSVGNIIY